MHRVSPDFYARARDGARNAGILREDPAPPERWMQQIWRHQRLHRDHLKTLDGQPLRVLHPGFWNRESGPDFTEAVVQIGNEPARRGDVELDRVIAGWQSHHHAGNPAYRQVVLHVVWTAAATDLRPPVLALKPFLDAPLHELAPWLENDAPGLLPGNLPGRCCAPLRGIAPEQFGEILRQAARIRLQRKASALAVRARQSGWDQALWEGLFGALGYKHNAWPMRRLAELTATDPATQPTPLESGALLRLEWEARLLGLSGLLPTQLPPGDARPETRRLWDLWWRERDAWEERVLPALVWRLSGVRPANHPQRRIVLAARWRAGGSLAGPLDAWLSTPGTMSTQVFQLGKLLTPPPIPNDYWSQHTSLRSRAFPRPAPLLGSARLTDLALNVILPWLHARAEANLRQDVLAEVERRYFAWPAAGDNTRLRLARQRLFGGASDRLPRGGAIQQGLHQILCDFCQRAGPLCDECQFPSVVLGLEAAVPTLGKPSP